MPAASAPDRSGWAPDSKVSLSCLDDTLTRDCHVKAPLDMCRYALPSRMSSSVGQGFEVAIWSQLMAMS